MMVDWKIKSNILLLVIFLTLTIFLNVQVLFHQVFNYLI